MPSRKTTEVHKILAAYLFSHERRSQKQIAEFLDVSPSVVSRLLADAEARKYFVKEYRFNDQNIPKEQLAEARQKLARPELADKLKTWAKRFGQRGPEVRIFPTPSAVDKEARMIEFGAQIAPTVAEYILRAKRCGITWGRMIMNVMRALQTVPSFSVSSAKRERIDFIPLAGELLGKEPTSSSSSTLAEDFGRVFNGDRYNARSLTMVPALIPGDFNKPERRALQKFIEMQPHYREIFGRVNRPRAEPTLAGELDCIITSIGSVPLGFQNGSLLHDREREMFLGDIGGVLIPKDKVVTEVYGDIKARWTGLCEEHLVDCATRAVEIGSVPGVVVMSRGAERAPVLLAAIQKGLANHIIIDAELGVALSLSL
jgi:DNA-binding transcriptional regulator LsrR (DeoR family)